MATAQDFLNSKSWCHNMEEYVFKKADLNKDGHICSEDRGVARGRFRDFALKKQRVDERALEAHEAATKELESAYGTGSDRVSKDDWLKKLAEVAAADLERIKKGEEPVLTKHAGPFFDVMDSDKDGFITLEDFKLGYVSVAGFDAATAEKAFKGFDKTNCGKIGREVFAKAGRDFWYKIDPPTA